MAYQEQPSPTPCPVIGCKKKHGPTGRHWAYVDSGLCVSCGGECICEPPCNLDGA